MGLERLIVASVSEGAVICKLMRFPLACERQQSSGCWSVHGCVSNAERSPTCVLTSEMARCWVGGVGGLYGDGFGGAVCSTQTLLSPELALQLIEVGKGRFSVVKNAT